MRLRQVRFDLVLLYFDLKEEKHCSDKDLEGSLVPQSPVRQHFPRPNRENCDTPGQKQNHKNTPEASQRAPVRGAAAGRAPSARYGARGHLRELRPRDTGGAGHGAGALPGQPQPRRLPCRTPGTEPLTRSRAPPQLLPQRHPQRCPSAGDAEWLQPPPALPHLSMTEASSCGSSFMSKAE